MQIVNNSESVPETIVISANSDLGRALIEFRKDTVGIMSETVFTEVEMHMATRLMYWVRQSQRELAKHDFELDSQDEQ